MGNLVEWLSDAEIEQIYTAGYWNDIELEKDKAWWIADGNYEECMRYLADSKLMNDYLEAQHIINQFNGDKLVVADFAAGIGWASAMLSRVKKISHIYAVEISRHRIELLLPHSVIMLDGDEDKITPCIGSFYNTKFPNESIDLVFMSQAFHHANEPFKLLSESSRILKKGGHILLIGEHNIGFFQILKKSLINLIKKGNFTFDFYELFPADCEMGDHYYRSSDYRFMATACGLESHFYKLKSGNAMYLLSKVR